MKKILVAGAAVALLGAFVQSAQAQIHAQVQVYPGAVVQAAPPPPPRYEAMPGPRHGPVWVPGHWEPNGPRHLWIAGQWVQQRPGFGYAQPAWGERDGRWHMDHGRWERRHGDGDFDRDGVPNRYDGDRDGDGVPNRYDRRPHNPYRY